MNWYGKRIRIVDEITDAVEIRGKGLLDMSNEEILNLPAGTKLYPTMWLFREISNLDALRYSVAKGFVTLARIETIWEPQFTFRFGEWEGKHITALVLDLDYSTVEEDGTVIQRTHTVSAKYNLGQMFWKIEKT
jgi:hypothetical protein